MARGGAAKEAANDTGRTELKTVVDNRTVGEILSEARIARGMDYAGVAEQLRIRRTYIEAIEEGRLGDLPGSTYAIGFVRTYAELMGLDVPKIVSKFKQEAADFEDRTQLVFPEPMPGSRGPTASVIVIAILMLAGAYGGWLYVSNKDRDTIELVPPLPEALTKLLSQATDGQAPAEAVPAPAAEQPAPLAAPVAESAPSGAATEPAVQPTIVNETIASAATAPEATSETVQEAGSQAAASVEANATETVEAAATAAEEAATVIAEEAAVEAAAGVSAETQETAAEQVESATAAANETAVPAPTAPALAVPAPAAPAASEEPAPAVSEPAAQAGVQEAETALPQVSGTQPAAFGTEAGASRIVIRATSPSWVEITAADGTVLLNRLLRTGDTFRVPDQPGIKLVTGSAGGLEFTVDGKLAPRIGEVGDVRRDVLLEPDALLKAQ